MESGGMTKPNGLTDSQDTGGGSALEESRSQASSLELDVTDPKFSFAADWEDGQNYRVTLDIQQTSPGRFTINDAKEEESPAEDNTETGEEGMGMEGVGEGESPAYPNPAVAKLMAGSKS